MSRCVLIDNEKLVILKVTPTVRQAEYWAELLCPTRDFSVLGEEARWFAAYNLSELGFLYMQSGGGSTGTLDYGQMVQMCSQLANRMTLDETPVDELEHRLGRALPPTQETTPAQEVATLANINMKRENQLEQERTAKQEGKGRAAKPPKAPKESSAPKVPRAPKDPSGRPSPTSATGKVWVIADDVAKKTKHARDSKELRKAVLEACATQGVNKSTASVQFTLWRQAA